jgi:hypothetical protein
MNADGTCPTCGRTIEAAAPVTSADTKVSLRELAGEKRAPWHFKLLMVLVVAYLAWRIVQMVGWWVG